MEPNHIWYGKNLEALDERLEDYRGLNYFIREWISLWAITRTVSTAMGFYSNTIQLFMKGNSIKFTIKGIGTVMNSMEELELFILMVITMREKLYRVKETVYEVLLDMMVGSSKAHG